MLHNATIATGTPLYLLVSEGAAEEPHKYDISVIRMYPIRFHPYS
jgi:hypothetical protein